MVQLTTSIGALVSNALSLRVRITSSPAITPKTPSNRPPVGCVSKWLPNTMGGKLSSRPTLRAKILPTPSTLTVQPASSHHLINKFLHSASKSVNAKRQFPPFFVAPILAISISDNQRRSLSIWMFFMRVIPYVSICF